MLKGRICLTATAIFACFAVFLCACGKDAGDASTTEPFVSWPEAQLFTVPTETQTAAPNDADADSETETVLRRIETARAVYGLFSETRPQLDKTDSVEIEDGLFAYRVTDPQLDTIEKLRAYVSEYFSDDVTQRLLNIGIYTQIEDDKLYALDVRMQSARSGELHVEVTEKTDTSEHYRLTVGSDTDRTYNYVYEKQSDGKWVFTRFEGY